MDLVEARVEQAENAGMLLSTTQQGWQHLNSVQEFFFRIYLRP